MNIQDSISIIIKMYTEDHFTMRKISEHFSCTPGYICQLLKKAGISSTQGEHVKCVCFQCNKDIIRFRKRWKNSIRQFCDAACYYAFLHNPDFVQSRQGLRMARKIVRTYFDLQPEHNIHHVDSNQTNNVVSNLWVFASASDHHKFERGVDIKPIWKGSSVRFFTRKSPRI